MTPTSAAAACRLVAFLAVGCSLAGPLAAADAGIQPFQVVVSPSPKAAARLASLGESITVAATFRGEPTREARGQADGRGQIDLGREEVVMPGERGVASITGNGVDPARLTLVKGRVQVLVNAYSARTKSQSNLLNCDKFQGSIKVAARQPIQIVCRLLTEPV